MFYIFLCIPCFCFKCNFKSYFQVHTNKQWVHWYCTVDEFFFGWKTDPFRLVLTGAQLMGGDNDAASDVGVAAAAAAAIARKCCGIAQAAEQSRPMLQHLNSLRIVTSGSKMADDEPDDMLTSGKRNRFWFLCSGFRI